MTSATPATSRFAALGSTAVVVTTLPDALPRAVDAVRAELAAIDVACSRFREDSELVALNAAAGRAVPVSPVLLDAILTARRAAEVTGGLVDPTVGGAMRTLGYDRDFRSVSPDGPELRGTIRAVPGWRRVHVDAAAGVVCVDPGVEVDLGATAKALAVDRALAAATAATEAGVLVSVGGDLAVGGPSGPDGWAVLVTDDHATDPAGPGQTVAIRSGALATSGTTVRRWRRGGVELHHVVDPRSGAPAAGCWRTVTVAAGCCVDANIASTAAVVMGPDAPAWLEGHGLPSRLVRPDGAVTTVAGWPDGAEATCASEVGA
jgi:thiamine biosynthesis lipoprotein